MISKPPIGNISGGFENHWFEMFESYLKILIAEMEHVPKPNLIMYDNHPSHINMELFKDCSERDIHIITFPFSIWRNELLLWERENRYKVFNEVSFIPILKKMMDTE